MPCTCGNERVEDYRLCTRSVYNSAGASVFSAYIHAPCIWEPHAQQRLSILIRAAVPGYYRRRHCRSIRTPAKCQHPKTRAGTKHSGEREGGDNKKNKKAYGEPRGPSSRPKLIFNRFCDYIIQYRYVR